MRPRLETSFFRTTTAICTAEKSGYPRMQELEYQLFSLRPHDCRPVNFTVEHRWLLEPGIYLSGNAFHKDSTIALGVIRRKA